MGKPSEKIVIMAKDVAQQWIRKRVTDEYRVKIYATQTVDFQALPGLLRSVREGKVKLGSVTNISDLGVDVGFDYISIWSSDRENLILLKDWLEKRGFETSGVW
jgi:hypothetical protein